MPVGHEFSNILALAPEDDLEFTVFCQQIKPKIHIVCCYKCMVAEVRAGDQAVVSTVCSNCGEAVRVDF